MSSPIQLNIHGCPAGTRFKILVEEHSIINGQKIPAYVVKDNYTSIIGIQNFLDGRHHDWATQDRRFPPKCRFAFVANYSTNEKPSELWKEALTLKELVDYLYD